MATCSNCLAKVDDNAKFCSQCGGPAPSRADRVGDPTGVPRSTTITIMLGIATLLLVGILNTTISQSEQNLAEAAKNSNAEALNAADAAMNAADAAMANSLKPWHPIWQKDDVRNVTFVSTYTESVNKIDLDFPYSGGSYLTLYARKHPIFGTDVVLELSKGQLVCRPRGCVATVRFDDHAPLQFRLNEPADYSHDTLFIRDASTFLSHVRKSSRAVIEIDVYEAGRPQFKFNISDFEWPKEN